MLYKVFAQMSDRSFVEVAQTSLDVDAHSVLQNYQSGMITKSGAIITTKNLKSEDTPTLFAI